MKNVGACIARPEKEEINMKILAIGDIVGEKALNKVRKSIEIIKKEYDIDFIITNGENVADGMGIRELDFKQMLSMGIDVVTLGNHTWGKKDIFNFIDHEKLLRPANYSKGVVGKGYGIYTCKDKNIAVINLIGRTDINVLSENPFTVAEEIINEIKDKVDIIVVDFHAEATAEKIAMGFFLDGKVNIIFGTHTHVQTADEKILPKGTAYITDIGMTGPINSVIGMDTEVSIKRFVTSLPERYKVAGGECMFNGCIFNINEKSCRTEKITRLKL